MRGGGGGLYRHGGASDSTNLDVIMGFNEQQLLVQLSHRNLINRKGFILCHPSPVNANVLLSLYVWPRHAHALPVRPRRAVPHHAHALGLGPARRGKRARARVVHRPPLTGFTSGVHMVHPLSRLISSSIPDTELSN